MHTLPHIDHGMHIVKIQIAEQPQQVQRLVQVGSAGTEALFTVRPYLRHLGKPNLMAGQTGRQIAMKVKDHI